MQNKPVLCTDNRLSVYCGNAVMHLCAWYAATHNSLPMLTKEEILAYLASKKAEFESEFQVTKLGLFGSYATDNPHKDSDIDIIIEFEPSTPELYEKKESIRSVLSGRFNKEIDLCREKYLKPYFRPQILKTAIYV